MTALQELKHVAQEAPDTQGFLLFRRGDEVGVIYCTDEAEEADEHCGACRDELMVFRPRGPSDALPHYLVACVGPTKFQRIQDGWRDTVGFDLRTVEFKDE